MIFSAVGRPIIVRCIWYQKDKRVDGLYSFCRIFWAFFAVDIGQAFELYFTSGDDCMKGNLSIFQYLFPLKEKFRHHEFLWYCGQHSRLDIFPNVSIVQIGAFVHLYMTFAVKTTFCVMDTGSVQSHQTVSKRFILLSHISFMKTKTVLVFLIKVSKICHVVLLHWKTTTNTLPVFDGPSFLTKTTSPQGNVYQTSNFQSIVQVSLNSGQFDDDGHFNITSVQFNNLAKLNITKTIHLTLPTKRYSAYNACSITNHPNITLK